MIGQSVKILFLTSSYPRNPEDTASVFLRYLAEYLAESGVDVHVLAPAEGVGGTKIERRVAVHRFRYFPSAWQGLAYGSGMLPNLKRSPWLWLQVPFFLTAMTCRLLRLHSAHGFDLFHAHWVLPQGLLGLAGARLFRRPLIVTVHGTDAFALRGGMADRLKHWILRSAAAWTANTANTASALTCAARLPQAQIIPMGVDVALFSTGRRDALRVELGDSDYLVLFVGRLIENKGCHDLLEAFSLLSEKTLARSTLWIVGDGDQRKHLAREAHRLGIGEKVRFFGAVNHRRLPDYYAAADLVVLPSKAGTAGEGEGQNLAVLEAFAARASVLAAAIGGIPSMVRDQHTGMLVDPGNSTALARAMETLLNDPARRRKMAAAAYIEVCQRYSWSRIAAEFKVLYEQVSSSSRGQARI